MKNLRITAKDRGLIKGAIRRVFSRSELRREALAKSIIYYTDPERPRVKKWSLCTHCGKNVPTYLMEIDHIIPIIPVDSSLEEMSWDEIVDRIWCSLDNLVAICKDGHKVKTKEENRLRRQLRKDKNT